MARFSRREGLFLMLGAARAVLLAAAGCQLRPSAANDGPVVRSERPPTPSALMQT